MKILVATRSAGPRGRSRRPAIAALATAFALSGAGAPPAQAASLLATVPVGTVPFGVAVNPVTNTVYVSNYGNGANASGGGSTLSVVDGATNTLTTTIAVGTSPYAVAVNPSTNTVYVTNLASNTVSVIDGITNTVTATIAVAAGPTGVAVDPATNTVYVTGKVAGRLTVIAGLTNAVIATIPVPAPDDVVVNPTTGRVYVVNDTTPSGSVSVFSGASHALLATIPVGHHPEAAAVNTATNRVYVANRDDSNLAVIDGATNALTATVPVGSVPRGVAVDPSTDSVYVGGAGGNSLEILSGATNTIIESVTLSTPIRVAVDPVTQRVYAASAGANAVSVVVAEKAPPVVTLTTPAAGAVYSVLGTLLNPVRASYSCADPGSGIASCSGTLPNGATLDTGLGAIGPHTFSVTATDWAGNTTSVTRSYRVMLLGILI